MQSCVRNFPMADEMPGVRWGGGGGSRCSDLSPPPSVDQAVALVVVVQNQ